jgi:hypothetical protein
MWTNIFVFLQQAVMLWDHLGVFVGRLSKYFIVYPIEVADRSTVIKCRHISLISVVCKQLDHVIAGYLMKAWDKNDWFYGDSMGLDGDTLVKVNSTKCART